MSSADRDDPLSTTGPGSDTTGHEDATGYSEPFPELDGLGVAEIGAQLRERKLSIREIVAMCVARIEALDFRGPRLRSVLEINPEAEAIAASLDDELRRNGPRGPLHGIPVLLKDNIDTADQMLTTAGSLALTRSRPRQDAFVARRLREAGAVLLGKTNMSEWANIRSSRSSSGWSGRGGQCRNPYLLHVTPCGSSSGSGAAVAAGFAPVAVGTETDGSIVCPASVNSVVGIKPTVGLVSRSGVIPISHSQDTVGPFGRTVADAAALLAAMIGVDPRDGATLGDTGIVGPRDDTVGALVDYQQLFGPDLRGMRIGVPRTVYWGLDDKSDAIAESALTLLRELGAEVVDPADIPTAEEMHEEPGEMEVLLTELKHDLNAYLAERGDPHIGSLADIIRFNEEHAAEELPFFGQDYFEAAEAKGPVTDPVYLEALARNQRLSRQEGIDAVMDRYRLDALLTPTQWPPWAIDVVNGDHSAGVTSSSPAALAGYPIVCVPAGYVFGRPVGVSFLGRAFSEPTLIRIAYAFERASAVRRAPRFLSGDPEGVKA